jgi:hypothetical protein
VTHPREFLVTSMLVGVIAALTGCDRVYEFPSEPSLKLTEATALEVARRAIEKAGYDLNDVEPVCYWVPCASPDGYFARSGPDATSGYILWRIKSKSDRRYHLDVRVTKTTRHIRCEVGTVK